MKDITIVVADIPKGDGAEQAKSFLEAIAQNGLVKSFITEKALTDSSIILYRAEEVPSLADLVKAMPYAAGATIAISTLESAKIPVGD